MKRIYNPPKTLKELVDTLKRRYPHLDRLVNENENAQVCISYCDSDEDEIDVEDTKDLVEAYRYGLLKKKKNVLKFNVNLFSKEEEARIHQEAPNPSQAINMEKFLDSGSEDIDYYVPKYE